VLTGIIFVLKTGIPWEELPQEMSCGCGMTCWNYLHTWQRTGVWQRLHEVLLNELQAADRIDWSRAAVDSTQARALGGGEKTGQNPTDRRKLRTKHHIVTDANGVPLGVTITGSNVHDVTETSSTPSLMVDNILHRGGVRHRMGRAPGVQIAFVGQILRQSGVRIVPAAKIAHLAADLFCPASRGMWEQWEVGVRFGGLALAGASDGLAHVGGSCRIASGLAIAPCRGLLCSGPIR